MIASWSKAETLSTPVRRLMKTLYIWLNANTTENGRGPIVARRAASIQFDIIPMSPKIWANTFISAVTYDHMSHIG